MTTLASLALSAESLASRHAPATGVPPLQKTLAELEAEAARLNAQQQQPSNQRGEALLAQSTFDARALHRQILELEQRAEFAQHRVEADGRDLDAALLARTDEVVVACIEGAVADAVEDGEKAALKEHLESWEVEKKRLLEDVGLKELKWETPAQKVTEDMQLTTVQSPPRRRALDDDARRHGEVVRRLNRYARLDASDRRRVDAEGGLRVASDFGALAPRPSQLSVAWRVVHAQCREDRSFDEALASYQGTKRTACDAVRFNASKRNDNWLALGCRRAVEAQYRDYVDAKLKDAGPSLRTQVMGVATFDSSDDAARYAAYLRWRHQLPRETQDMNVLRNGEAAWPQLYAALRCGGARGGLAVCSAEPAFGVGLQRACRARAAYDDAVEVLGWAVDVDNAQKKVDETARELESARRACAAEHAAVLASGTSTCPYYASCANLLSLDDADLRDERVQRTVEDFCWHALWFATSPGGSREALRRAATQWGAAHFDPDGETPLQYATVLLLAGDCAGALAHLQKRRLPQEALHLGLALDAYGLLEHARSSTTDVLSPPKRHTTRSPFGGNGQPPGSLDEGYDLARACLAYARHVAAADASIALEYVFWPRHRDALVKREVSYDDFDKSVLGDALTSPAAATVSILLDTRAYDVICGAPTPASGRGRGALDDHLPPQLADQLIKIAARDAQKRGRPADAARLHSLTGDDVSVLRVLVERLGQVVSTVNDADRTFWLETCNDFAERRIAAVVNELRATDEEELGYAFESLLNLAQFFDAVRADACSDALRSLDATRFVPSTDDSVGPCLDAFYRRDPTVQRLLPEVLGATMDVITKAYQSGRRARQDARFASAAAPGKPRLHDAADAAAQDLRKRAALLVDFAGLLKARLPDDVHARLGALEAMML